MGKSIAVHVHCRDAKESYKDTILRVSAIAKIQRIEAIFDMPNTDPPILKKEDVETRLKMVKEKGCFVRYYLFVGLTADSNQIREAAEMANTHPQVVGLKLFSARSVGNLGVTTEEEQIMVYQALAELKFEGVLAVHCEKESLMRPELWDPTKPWTHGLARPPASEIESVEDQIKFAKESGYQGHLHICHISCPESADLVLEAKRCLRITCAVTPQHLLFSEEVMRTPTGLLYKVNPPLRSSARVEILRDYLLRGKIDWIEPDHARHTKEEKLGPPYLSGIPSLDFWLDFLAWLRRIGLANNQIEDLTSKNILKVFRIKGEISD